MDLAEWTYECEDDFEGSDWSEEPSESDADSEYGGDEARGSSDSSDS